jgi:hypothetical protein
MKLGDIPVHLHYVIFVHNTFLFRVPSRDLFAVHFFRYRGPIGSDEFMHVCRHSEEAFMMHSSMKFLDYDILLLNPYI